MKKILGLFIGLTMLVSCEEMWEKEKIEYDAAINAATFNVKVVDLKEVSRGKYTPNFYLIDENKNSYNLYESDYVRLQKGDSLKINSHYTYIDIIEIY